MDTIILKLEKGLFKYEYMSNVEYLNSTIDDMFIEIGKSGKKFTKEDVIKDLSIFKEDRKINIYITTLAKK